MGFDRWQAFRMPPTLQATTPDSIKDSFERSGRPTVFISADPSAMEKHDEKNDVFLLSETYKDENSASSSSLPSPTDFEPQPDKARAHWMRTSFDFLKNVLFWKILALLVSFFVALVPSFISRFFMKKKKVASNRSHSPTAYLDGLRGIACFIVYCHHFVLNWFPNLRNAYGATPADHYFFQLPIIRVLFEGQSAVATFFVVSGFAVSYSALFKIHTGNNAGAFETLSSSTFRRCMRLYLPCVVSMFICMLLQYAKLFHQDPLHWNNMPPRFDTLSEQIRDWWENMKIFIYPFLQVEAPNIYGPPYNGHLWTIPLEIRGSFVVYGTVLAAAKLMPFWRMAFLVVWDVYLYYMGKWDLFLFVGGIVLANLDIPRHAAAKAKAKMTAGQDVIPEGEGLLPTNETVEMTDVGMTERKKRWLKLTTLGKSKSAPILKALSPTLRVLRIIVPYVLFFLALWIISFPHIPWMGWVYDAIPDNFNRVPEMLGHKDEAMRICGAILLAFSLSLSPSPLTSHSPSPSTFVSYNRLLTSLRTINLQSLFTNRFSQYLGRISFGFYLMHGPVLFCIGTRFFLNPAWKAFDANHDLGAYVRKFVLAVLVNTMAIIWVGDVFTRVVDERTVRWAAWCARKMSRKVKRGVGGRS